MADTYSQIYVHLVFSVKGRQSLIQDAWKDRLYKYICGIASGKGQKVFAIGGVADHIHLLVSMKPSISVSELVRDLKSNSSKWLNEQGLFKGKFEWQNGFGAFTCGHTQLNSIIAYVNNQEIHHKKETFKEEYLKLLKEFEIEFKEQFLFDWM
jgi:putative transposase